jgi:prepilin peptidase CpaA
MLRSLASATCSAVTSRNRFAPATVSACPGSCAKTIARGARTDEILSKNKISDETRFHTTSQGRGCRGRLVEKYFFIGAVLVALVGAFIDVRSARLPNRLTYSALIIALMARTALLGWAGLKSGAIGILIAGGFFCVLFVLGAMGGGDMKMMAAVGAWVGSSHILTVLIAIGLAGGLLALVFMIFAENTIQTVRNTVRLMAFRFTSGLQPHPEMNVQAPGSKRVPFGVAIAMGILFCSANANWWR